MTSSLRALTASALCISFAVSSAAQNPGEILWHQKISTNKGGGPLGVKGNDQFGRGAAALGDVDGDGVCDFAVGALGDDDNQSNDALDYGSVWILFMKRDGTVKSYYQISKTSGGLPLDAGDEWGRTVRELGDWDLDGIPDVMVGTNYDDDNGTDKGAFYMLFLNRDGSVKSWKKISETTGGFTGDLDPDDQFGRGLRVLGDLDLDGVPEIGVGSIRDDDGGSNRGAYWILFMRRDGTVRSWTKLSETQGNFQSKLSDYGEFGFDACVLGDRNGDGIQDIAIASPDQKTDNNQQGAVFIVYMNRNGTAKADFRIAENWGGFNGTMLDYNDEFGCAIDNVGDVDRDGIADIVVGAGKDDDGPPGSFDRGAMYVLFLNANATVKGYQKISRLSGRFYGNIDNADRFGTSLACPGDLNLDGVNDLLVGVRFDDDGGSAAGCEYFVALNDGRFTPPVAKFVFTPNRGRAPHAVQFTDQSTGTVTGWEWDFGDGTTSTERNPVHTYYTTGFKTISLTIRGQAGNAQRVQSNVIKVDAPLLPVAAFQAAPVFGMAPLDVQFDDLSTGLITSWAWDFGDGATSTESEPRHVYTAAGRYGVTLRARNQGGERVAVRTDYVVVTDVPPPTADFGCDTTSGLAPLAVQFQDATAGDVTARTWDFGDGSTSIEPNPRHVYSTVGTFTVSLAASGPGGADTETKTALVTVAMPPPPVADFTLDTLTGIDPLTVTFTNLTAGAATSFAWSFGDGTTATAAHPVHTYALPGVYTVGLVATGPGGSDEEIKLDLVSVVPVVRGLVDPSFEEQAPALPPEGAWTVFGSGRHVVEPEAQLAADGTFPADGTQWLRLSTAGTSFTQAPTAPGGVTEPAIGGAGVTQSFYLEDGQSVFEFDAAFVRGGAAADPLDADWMSVDVSDGVTTVNLFFADASTPAPELSAVLGLPKTAKRHVSADLRALFPSSVRNTRFTLTLQVGNGGDDVTPSFALVDDLHLGTWTPPVAQFDGTPKRARAPHEVQFTDLSTGHVTGWTWSFGDGTTSTEQNPRHTFLTKGIKTVTLTARGPGGTNRRVLANVFRTDPPLLPAPSFAAAPVFGMAPLEVTFDETSTGLVTTWAWDFGDGTTSNEREPVHVYANAGRYAVALTTGNEAGARTATRVEYVVVTDVPPPAAAFGCDVLGGLAPLAVQFADQTTGDVTSWAWSFGDGATSTAQHPQHVYGSGGVFTVTLVASGPGGADVESKIDLITVTLPAAPAAAFVADVTTGIDPLTVSFTNLSTGLATGFAWSFGDGSTATAANPTHTYVAPGTYTVRLVATGPGGSDEEIAVDLVAVVAVPRGIADASFELQTAAAAPAGAWSVLAGIDHVVEPAAGIGTDGTFPGDGAQWLRLSSAGTSFALPPTVLGGETAPALGGAGVEQSFYLDEALSVLEFDAAFVRGGAAADRLDNDWMSVDVSDGLVTINLYFADGTSATPEISDVLGHSKTAMRRVSADLRALFPGSVRNTRFTLTLQVGNGGEDVTPSYALIDDLRLEQALGTALRYGCDPLVRGSLKVLAGTPHVGTTITLGVDNPLGTQGPNSRAYLWMSTRADAAYPCGTPLANFGMAGPGASGEILVVRTSGILLKTVTGGLWSTPGTAATIPLALPSALSWIGSPLYVQGYLVDSRMTYGVRTGVTDALKLLVGP